ncbi:Tn3 family transposase [Streptomyces sp. NBC_01799]|uniref:Tn3 family transposase n=1 Tax=Streptomyces sp. NBC_01800 TaxID=2975945 RepID=UPI002DDAC541|nr:Tn3 family transposase [Streptomyces sp. NBC_01800]WSA72287.1 Tn3 family transposase [Streptomyces sp. NBC_01800]WSA82543.1 Tn3 family transposase [Streptomyces sp. NBC_01799]
MTRQLGALGLALNAVVLFNSLYIDAAVKQLAADGFPVTDELLARALPAAVRPPSAASTDETPSAPRRPLRRPRLRPQHLPPPGP